MLLQKINLKMKRWSNNKKKTKQNIVKKKRVYPRNCYRNLSEEEKEKKKENRRNCQTFPPVIKKRKIKTT